jgi:Tfp pilus assembly protein PilF
MRGDMNTKMLLITLSFLFLVPQSCSHRKTVDEPEFDRELMGDEIQFGRKAAKFQLWHEAVFRWEKVIAEDAENVQALNNLGVAYEALGDFEKAKQSYEKALDIDESVTPLRNNYKRFLHFYKRHKRNQKRLEKRLEKEKMEQASRRAKYPAGNGGDAGKEIQAVPEHPIQSEKEPAQELEHEGKGK